MKTVFCLFLIFGTNSLFAGETRLAAEGKPLLAVMQSQEASDNIRTATSDLAATLGRMIGHEFSVESGGAARGLIVGTVAQFPKAPGAGKFASAKDSPAQQRFDWKNVSTAPKGKGTHVGSVRTPPHSGADDLHPLQRTPARLF